MKTHITRTLRRNQTPWEQKLWRVLRNSKLENLKFRRQHNIGKYVVDFCCLSKKLVIEIDGGQHNIDAVNVKDKQRQKYIEDQGYKVLRFWNNEIDNNLAGVIERIVASVTA